MSVTIKDIASAADLSNQAVSAVLNGKTNSRVSPATREKILKLAKQMNYVPNFSSRHLRRKSTKTVALLLCEKRQKSQDYIKNMIIRLISGFEEISYSCFLAEFTRDADSNVRRVRELTARGVDSFIALGNPYGAEKIREILKSAGKPCFAYGGDAVSDRYLVSDTAAGAEGIIRFFLGRNRNNFRLMLNEEYKLRPAAEAGSRIKGLFAAIPGVDQEELIQRHVVLMPKIDIAVDNVDDGLADIGYTATKKLLEQYPDVQAIAYLSDPYALGGAKYLIEQGIPIGKDIALAGFNNTFAVRNYPFPISSVEQNIEQICLAIIREFSSPSEPIAIRIPPIVHLRG